MKLLISNQIRELDQKSIIEEQITSTELMMRASKVYFTELLGHIKGKFKNLIVICGSGNNGGDGVAVATLCTGYFNKVEIWLCAVGKRSPDLEEMLRLLPKSIRIVEIEANREFPSINKDQLIVDALFGSGLNRKLDGYWAALVEYINNSGGYVCAIDIPSGMFCDHLNNDGAIISAQWTLSFEMPKLSFFYPENDSYLGEWKYSSIGLSKKEWNAMKSDNEFVDQDLIKSIFKSRPTHSHKGSFGHAALITGSYGMSGASILSAKGCLRSGVGKLSVYVPEVGLNLMQGQVPEAICAGNNGYQCIEQIKLTYNYESVGIGCGLGKNVVTKDSLARFLKASKDRPLIIDADALNIISEEGWQDLIPKGSLLTPHLGEFERLFGKGQDSEETYRIQDRESQRLNLYILLKGAYSRLTTPDGKVFFNRTGNPGMATAGSGDVLTGILTGIKAQGYNMREAGILGMYVHGLAGDLAAEKQGQYGLIASDIIDYLPRALKSIENLLLK
jgi:NAD(P)H-hydrate epimerase